MKVKTDRKPIPSGKPSPKPMRPAAKPGKAPVASTPEAPEAKPAKPWLFQKGQPSANPNGRPKGVPNYRTLFQRALQKVQHDNKFDLFEEFVKQARINPTVMIAAVKKLIPDKSEISFGTTELQQAQGQILEIITKHVHDPAVLAAIAADLEALAEQAEEEFTRA